MEEFAEQVEGRLDTGGLEKVEGLGVNREATPANEEAKDGQL